MSHWSAPHASLCRGRSLSHNVMKPSTHCTEAFRSLQSINKDGYADLFHCFLHMSRSNSRKKSDRSEIQRVGSEQGDGVQGLKHNRRQLCQLLVNTAGEAELRAEWVDQTLAGAGAGKAATGGTGREAKLIRFYPTSSPFKTTTGILISQRFVHVPGTKNKKSPELTSRFPVRLC
eukprot:767482-Hanusia_phi.AAC.1